MEALYTWMTEQGLDPATFPYIAGALLVVLLLVVLRLSRRQSGPGVDQDKIDQDTLDQQAAEAAVQAEANRLAEEKAEAERQAAEQEAARKVAEEAAQRAQEEADAERLASEQAAARKAAEEEAERVAAEQAAAAERQAREEAEQRIKEAEKQARLKAEQAEAERQATAAVDAARQAAEAEAARVAAETEATEAEEKAAAVEREAQEEIERARAAAEQAAAEEAARQQAEADERERLAKEEEERLAREEAARLAAEQAAAAAEAERLAREEAERQAAEDAARQLAEAEAARKAAEAEVARKAAEEEAERIAAEKAAAEEAERQAAAAEENKGGFFARIKSGLSRTKANLTEQLGDLFLGAKEIDEDLLEEIETTLLMADVGVEATTEIIEHLTDRVERKQLKDADALKEALQQELAALLGTVEHKLQLPEKKPAVILMVGVNGVGKTTTIGKLAKKFQSEGKSVMLAAGDTFRAAAVEQLQVWGERNNVPVVAQHTGADSASVIFDALQSAQSKGVDVLIADTAGRLQNKDNLMQELQKVVRVMQKLDPDAPHEVMLVLDAGTGQNAISQAKQFKESVGVSGITLTKLDGTAKGGIIFAIAKQFDLPIRFIGVGEQVDDLRPFEAEEFVKALFD